MANKRNYAKELNTLIETFTHEEKRPTLLLHACCAPCFSAVLEKLTAHFKITVLFYNPNIYPEAEYQKREAELKRLISEMPCTKEVALVDLPYVPEEFFTAVRGLEHIPEGDDDYINCPMNKEEYDAFYEALITAERAPIHDFDVMNPKVYEGCMPIEVMAQRGHDTIRFGPLKPVGLRDPRTGHRPWAVVQLRTENAEKTLFNLVGFQTNLKFPEQKRVFGMIPGLKNAEYMRYGVMHRNTFLDSPKLLNADFSMRTRPELFFAGQMTGVEGYMESASSGLLAGRNAVRRLEGKAPLILPITTMMGSLAEHAAHSPSKDFQPMGANFGILPVIEPHIRDKKERYAALSARALEDLAETLKNA